MRAASITLALLLLGFSVPCQAAAPQGQGAAVAAGRLDHSGARSGRGAHGQGQNCRGCHVKQTQRGHPSGFVAQRTLPPGFLLEPGGRFACRTCHDAQLAGGSLPTCGRCHEPTFFAAMVDGGTSLNGQAHPEVLDGPSNAGVHSAVTACLSCHMDHGDGQGAGTGAGGLMYAASRSAPRNHPIGLPYDRATVYGGYVPAAMLPPEVKLFDGRLGCLSCHRSYSARHGSTVLPTAGSRLCFACHDL